MTNAWIECEWRELCQRLQDSAEHLTIARHEDEARVESQVNAFCSRESPLHYMELLDRVRDAARLAIRWQRDVAHVGATPQPISESLVDETLDESFPASDPPSWTSAAI